MRRAFDPRAFRAACAWRAAAPAEVAEAAGLPRARGEALARGEVPTPAELEALARVLEVPPDTLTEPTGSGAVP